MPPLLRRAWVRADASSRVHRYARTVIVSAPPSAQNARETRGTGAGHLAQKDGSGAGGGPARAAAVGRADTGTTQPCGSGASSEANAWASFAGSISRAEAEELLRGRSPGTYLLRRKGPTTLVLSLVDKSGRPKHAMLESSSSSADGSGCGGSAGPRTVRVGNRTFATFAQCWEHLRAGPAKHGLRFHPRVSDKGASYVLRDDDDNDTTNRHETGVAAAVAVAGRG